MRKKGNLGWMGLFAVCVAAATAPAVAQEVVRAYPLEDDVVAPEYPPAALAVRFSGSVTLAAHVDTYGMVSAVEVVDCSHPKVGFEEAAVAAIEQWNFEPARLDGTAVDSIVLYRMGFDIPERGLSRDHPGTSGQFLGSGLLAPGISGRDAARSMGSEYSTNASRRKLHLVTPNLPPNCLGCMYDRRHLLPTPQRGSASQAFLK